MFRKRGALHRKRNQLTLPSEVVNFLRIQGGDQVIIEVKAGLAIMRPVRRSYAGLLRGVYGDAQQYVERERADWE